MAQTTTSSTVHEIVKYSSSKTLLSAQTEAKEIQWKHHTSEQLRLTLDITKTHKATGSQSLARYTMRIAYLSDEPAERQHPAPELILEKLDLSSFSEIKYRGRELPLKAVYKNATVAFRYLSPLIQNEISGQTYRRFQITFKSETEALDFVQSIQFVCPCDKSRIQQPVQPSQAETLQSSSPPGPPGSQKQAQTRRLAFSDTSFSAPLSSKLLLERNAMAQKKHGMFVDPLSYSSLDGQPSSPVGAGSSPEVSALIQPARTSSPVSASHGANRMSDDTPMDTSAAQRSGPDDHLRFSIPSSSPIPSILSSQSAQPPFDSSLQSTEAGVTKQNDVHVVAVEGQTHLQSEPGTILSALRQGDSDLYQLSFDELRQMVSEIIREPGFPELVGRVHKMWKEQVVLDLQK